MSLLFDRAGAGADYEELHVLQDAASGLRAVVAVHSTRLGPGTGGIRRKAYASEADAVRDALALASAMTLKCAAAELPNGGAKTVILDRPGTDVPAAYRALGRAIERMGGRYLCGPDVGTGDAEMAEVRKATRHANPPGSDTGRATAVGVLAALRGTLRALGEDRLEGQRFLVQGLGSVGLHLARALLEEGAVVLGSDVDPKACEAAAALGARVVAPAEATTTPCDVFVPCALGGVLTEAVARDAPFRAVCGSANNQLASPEVGRRLHERGVLYAPDFVANAGGVVQGVVLLGAGKAGEPEVARRLADIGPRVESVLREALETDTPPHDVAVARARARLEAAPQPSGRA